jgi:O-antigen/teichoic acid export membrane protein/glycosyltransferase involved in cell wall biosynthesis
MIANLKTRAAAGVTWVAMTYAAGLAVQLLAGVVLARLLTPSDFGTAGLALVIAGIISAVNQLGLFASIVQRKELEDRHYDTALLTSFVSGAAFGAVLLAAAPALAAAFRNPGLAPVLRLYSVLLFAGGLSAVQSALLSREFHFRAKSLATLASRVAGAALSVGLAFAGLGVMSVAWGYVVQMVSAVVLLSVPAFRVRRPGLRVSFSAFRDLFRYGFGVMGANLLDQLSGGLDMVLVGRLMGPLSLGYYSLSSQTATYVPRGLGNVLSTVVFSTLARVQDQAVSLRSACLRLSRTCALLAAPLLVGLAVLAPDLVPAVFGPKWIPSIVPLQLLALAGVVMILDWVWAEILKARGRSLQLLTMTAGRILALAATVWAGSRFGLTGVAAALVGFRLIFWLAYQAVVNRSIGLPMTDYARAVAGPLLTAVGVGCTALATRLLVGSAMHGGHWAALAAGVVAAAVSYPFLALLLARGAVMELLDLAAGLPMVGQFAARCAKRLQMPGLAGPERICVMTSVHPAADVRIYHKQALTLSRAGYDVVLIAPAHLPKDGVDETQVRLAQVRLPRSRPGRMVVGSLRILGAALRAHARIYHVHDPELLPVALLLKAVGKRVVYDAHEDYPEQVRSKHYLPKSLRGAVSSLVGFAEKAIAARLDGVVCATDAIAASFHQRTGRLRSQYGCVATVRNYPELSAVNPTPPTARNRPGIGRRCRLVHLSGTLTPERGVTSMVRAMELLDDRFELVLAGRFVTPEYEAAVRAMAGFRRVRYVKPIPHKQVWGVYEDCDAGIVCLLPLERYKVSLPVKLFEFMAAGLPVVASDFPLFRELVEGNGCGICVDPEAPECIASAAQRFAGDEELVRQMGELGRKAVLERYNWEAEAQTLLDLYRTLGTVPARGQSPAGNRAGIGLQRGTADVQ